MLSMLPEVFDGTHSFLKCNSLLLHVLQESVSAKILTHSSWNLCKLILAAAPRGYSPQSLTCVQFSMCAAQHSSDKSDQDWLDGSKHCEHCNRGSSEHWNIPVRRGTSGLGWRLSPPSRTRETAWAEKVHRSHLTLEASVQRDRLWLLSLEMWHRVVTNFTMQTWSVENGHHCCFSVTAH